MLGDPPFVMSDTPSTCPQCWQPARPISYALNVPEGGHAFYCDGLECEVREFTRKSDGRLQ